MCYMLYPAHYRIYSYLPSCLVAFAIISMCCVWNHVTVKCFILHSKKRNQLIVANSIEIATSVRKASSLYFQRSDMISGLFCFQCFS